MTQILITITTLSPLYAGAFKPYGAFMETASEISGALVRGAVTHKTLPDCAAPEFIHNHEACAVKDICPFYYLTTGVAFPTCAIAEGGRPTEPPLRTMVTCKATPGFASQSTTREPKHGVLDTLLHHLAFNELRRLRCHPAKLPPQDCMMCDAPLESFPRRYVKGQSGRYRTASSIRTRRMTRVSINRRRETAEHSLLFSIQTIAEGTQFIGHMTVPDQWDDKRVVEFQRVLASITRIGGEQTYGLGRVEVTVKEAEDSAEDVLTRVYEFNECLEEVWREYATESRPILPEGYYLTIDFLNPTLLMMSDGTPTVHLTAEMVQRRAEELGFANLPDLEVVECPDASGQMRPLMFTAPRVGGGWSEAKGLPKPPALVTRAGSVYVFRTNDVNPWHDALINIEAHGIGTRREEGFGAVRVCDPFHREVVPV